MNRIYRTFTMDVFKLAKQLVCKSRRAMIGGSYF